ncbi:Oligopeptide transporter OPT superfamily [Corchorus capsularis]|uniref:Oligopeptide transporter OPT superfamily n=1 Tax=Corchorus capsularis TaxID=210143 RepID=A0A1R3FYA4_COCAP|nr:Oligopeptide transporter OPT superfamily [Corchorus capsularis]
MGTGEEIEAAPKVDDGKLKQELEDNESELSPIEEVRLTVPNTDDPSLPVWTFRMWFLGLFSCVLLSFINTFFSYRSQQLIVTQITVQVTTLPIGRFMASTLPTTKFRIPGFGSRLFSLNQGPFNMKEHVLITIFANAGAAFGNGTAYAVGIVTIIKAFYGRNISFVSGWLLILTTQIPIQTENSLKRKPRRSLPPQHTLSMSTLEIVHNIEEDDDDVSVSPVEEVRLTVSNDDDPSLPVWTFRMWFLGLFSCCLLSFLNTFFSYRTEPLQVTMISIQVASLPVGKFMVRVLPTTKFKIPGFGNQEFTLNPGPFNVKEHVLISIFANAGAAFGGGTAYAISIVNIIRAFYHKKISFLASWILVVTTQETNQTIAQ